MCVSNSTNSAGVFEGAEQQQHSTAVRAAVVLDAVAAPQQQQQQQRLGCFGSWGAGMFRQPSAPVDSRETAATAAAAGVASGVNAHVEVVYSSSRACQCKCGRSMHGAAAAKPAPPVLIQQLPCGHEFCVGCIGTWLAEHVTCPICRWSFPEEQTQLINMHK
jgi:hypothetical protein